MEITRIKVYILLNKDRVVTRIESTISPIDFTDWTEVDEGNGDKYSYAQNNYLAKGLVDTKGRFNYKYNTALIEITEAEKEVLFPPIPPRSTETEKLKSDIDFLSIINTDLESKTISQQSDIDYLLILQEG